MNINPGLHGQLATERQRDMLAQASRQRLARQARDAALTARRADRAGRRTTRLFRQPRPVISPS